MVINTECAAFSVQLLMSLENAMHMYMFPPYISDHLWNLCLRKGNAMRSCTVGSN